MGIEIKTRAYQRVRKINNAMKDPHWYAVQGSDTTMLTMAASLPG